MNCTNPLVIPRPGFPDRPSQIPGRSVRNYAYDTLVVPCGKCMACTQKRQNDFAFRIRTEAENRGSLCFLTLTYDDDHLPLVSTLWKCDKVTGESERLTKPEFVCYAKREDFYEYRKDISQIKPSSFPRYLDVPFFEDDEVQYFTRITPSVCRKDVQLWLKRCRVWFERKYDRKLDLSYAICSEYGSKFCRPHYHCALMGISEDDAMQMAWLWKFGFTKTDFINVSDFSKVANYIGKYVSKGDFECQSVKDCTAMSCRQMTSKGLGSSAVDKLRPFMLCYDMVGYYDPDTFFNGKRYLSRSEMALLVSEVPKRLVVNYDSKCFYSVPRILRNQVFYVKTKSPDGKKVYCRPSKLWRMVVDALQCKYAELDCSEFRQLLTNKSPREVTQAVASFNLMSENFGKASDDSRKENYKTRLQSSVF